MFYSASPHAFYCANLFNPLSPNFFCIHTIMPCTRSPMQLRTCTHSRVPRSHTMFVHNAGTHNRCKPIQPKGFNQESLRSSVSRTESTWTCSTLYACTQCGRGSQTGKMQPAICCLFRTYIFEKKCFASLTWTAFPFPFPFFFLLLSFLVQK